MSEVYLLMAASPAGFEVVAIGPKLEGIIETGQKRIKESMDRKPEIEFLEQILGKPVPDIQYLVIGPLECWVIKGGSK